MPTVRPGPTLARVAQCLITAGALATLVACGGADPDPAAPTAAATDNGRERALNVPAGLTIPADAASKGMFGPVSPWPLIAVHGVLTPDGRVLSYGTKTDGTQTGYFVYSVWNPATGEHTTYNNNTGTDIFCSSQLVLADASGIVINGGDVLNAAGTQSTHNANNNSNVFSAGASTLTRGPNMNRSRWYSSATMLLNGEIYIQGGSGGTDRPEVRMTDGNYRLLSGVDTSGYDMMYPRNFVAPDGRVFGYVSGGQMYYVNPAGSGVRTPAGQLNGAVTGSDSSAAMFAPGRILQYGGGSNQAVVIDITGASPTVTATGSMLRQRKLSTAVIMANGHVVATGGSRVWNEMTDVSYEAEMWNPQTGQWTAGALANRARLYHGNGLLLPDATVLVFGGGAPGPQVNTNHEIFYPPYLFTNGSQVAARPVITTAPTVVDVGRTVQLTVSSGRPIARVTFVKTGSATHGWNMDQRFAELPFSASGNQLSVQIPGRASDVPPGMWMMFAIDDAGVPSVARLVRVNTAGALNNAVAPVLQSPGNQSTAVGDAVDLQLAASDPNGDPLSYSASGLPAGLNLDAATGRISGSPQAAGSFNVTLAVSDGYNSATQLVTWTVSGSAPLVLQPVAPVAPSIAGSSTAFTASASGTGVNYRWEFGDGSASDWSANAAVSKTFANPGIYFVTVTARDSAGTEARSTIVHHVHLPLTANAPQRSGNLALEQRAGASARLWVVNPDNDSVSVIDTATQGRVAEIAVGTAPRALAIAPDGTVWVTNKRGASISVINPATLAVSRTIALPRASQPYGIAFARAGNAALVALEATATLLKLDAGSGALLTALAVGDNPRDVAVAADGSTAYVSRFITPPLPGEATAAVQTAGQGGQVVVVDAGGMNVLRTIVLAHSDKPDFENQGRGIPNYLGAMAISPDGSQAFVPSKQDNLLRGQARDGLALNFQSTVRAISSRVLMSTQAEDLSARIDHDNASLASAAAFDPLGVYLFVALETSREVAVLDAHSRAQVLRIDVGRAPQGLLVSPDRRTLYVMNFMDRTVGAFDLRPLIERGQTSVTPLATIASIGTERLAANVLLGKQHFYDARDTRLARDRYMSCASCHNDGGHDGRVWDLGSQGEGLRNTINLRGRAGLGQGRLHWSHNFDEVQDFEGQIRTLAGGTGLMSDAAYFAGTRSQPLGDAKAGFSADLDALAAYVASLNSFDPSPRRQASGALTALAAEGRNVFINLNCASCHAGTGFTKSAASNAENIGTLKPTSGNRLGGAFSAVDVPTLRDVWASAPYLHDGSAPTLEAAVRAHNNVTVSDADLNRLVAYLREIGSEEASAPSPNQGLMGSYFNNITLSGGASLTRNEAVDFDWGSGVPATGINADNFSVRWSGRLVVPSTGSHVFQTESDDGVRLWVNGVQVINNWTDHSPTLNNSAGIALTAGAQVDIVMEYYERTGGAVARLRWQPPGSTGFVAIPAAQLVPVALTPPVASQGLAASYFNNITLGGAAALTRTEAVNFNWGTASPGAGVNADNFSARWTGVVVIPTTGSYRFRTYSDDGVRLWIGGTQRINNWTDHAPTYNTSTTLSFTAGQRVPVTLEFYERTGGAVMQLQWLRPGTSSYVAVPIGNLAPN